MVSASQSVEQHFLSLMADDLLCLISNIDERVVHTVSLVDINSEIDVFEYRGKKTLFPEKTIEIACLRMRPLQFYS